MSDDFKQSGGSPWGTPPGGGGRSPGGNGSGTRQDPPSLDDIIKNLQKTINKFLWRRFLAHVSFFINCLDILATLLNLFLREKSLYNLS